jgi:hypothetical protein
MASHSKNDSLLISVAESVGSTLGSIAAKADAAKNALVGGDAVHTAERKARSVKRKAKTLVKKAKRSTVKLKRSKAAKVARKTVRGAKSVGKKLGRRTASALRSAKRRRRK